MVARMAGKGLVPYPPWCCGLLLLFDLEVCAVDEAIVITAEVHEVDNNVFVAVVTLEGVTLVVLLDELFSVGTVCVTRGMGFISTFHLVGGTVSL